MNGIFNSGLSFWEFIVGIAMLVLGTIAIRISLTFNLNKYLESRQTRYTQKLKNACTHMELMPTKDGHIEVRSLFVSPPGTLQWQCQRCGLTKYQGDGEWERTASYYLKNPDEYHKQNKKFKKLLKKSGLI